MPSPPKPRTNAAGTTPARHTDQSVSARETVYSSETASFINFIKWKLFSSSCARERMREYEFLKISHLHGRRPCINHVCQIFGIFDPLTPCQQFGPIYSTKISHPPLLRQILAPSPPIADVICACPQGTLTEQIGKHDMIIVKDDRVLIIVLITELVKMLILGRRTSRT